MSSKQVLLFAVVAVFAPWTIFAYPTELPYTAKEKALVPTIPRGTPADKITDIASDANDHCYTCRALDGDPTKKVPFGFYQIRIFEYLMVKAYKRNPYADGSMQKSFNCSQSGVKLDGSFWDGTWNSKKACEDGNCCKNLHGSFLRSSHKGIGKWTKTYAERSTAAGCSADVPAPEVFCSFVGKYILGCNELFSGTKAGQEQMRTTVLPCANVMYRYFMSCKLYSAWGDYIGNQEPKGFLAKLSDNQKVYVWALNMGGYDKVCNPYSYYYPEASDDRTTSAAFSGVSATFGAMILLILSLC